MITEFGFCMGCQEKRGDVIDGICLICRGHKLLPALVDAITAKENGQYMLGLRSGHVFRFARATVSIRYVSLHRVVVSTGFKELEGMAKNVDILIEEIAWCADIQDRE